MAPCALLALFAAVAAGPVEEIPPPSGVDSGFGSVIDAHDGRLIIAAPTSSSGTGYAGIYEWQTDQWIETWSLDTNAMEPGDAAGASVALANDWAAIGVPGDHQVIMLNRGMDGSWHIDQIIDGPSDSTLFGSAIDIDGERMLIGAPGGNARISGYMIEQVDVDGDLIWQWIEQGSIQSPVGSGSGWGSAVSIEMEIGAAGIPEHNENSGGLYRLELESGSFQIIENCSTDIPWLLGNAGTAVDVRNQWILASAPGYAISENSGITWVLSQSADPDEENQWVFRTYMIPPPGIANAQFGESMTSSLTRACIGAPAADGGGMIFVYDLKVDGAEIDYLGQVQPDMISEGDQFGADLALLDGHLIVGAPGRDANGQDAGGVLVLDLENATEHVLDAAVPIEIAEHMPAHGNLIPSAIGVGTDRMVLGIPHANSNDGEVQVLQRTNGDWTLSSSIKGTASAMFGHSVEQTRNLTIIGSPGAEGGTGEVQIYREDEGSIVLEQTLSPLGLANSTFGYSIAVHSTAPDMSTYLAVGAPSIDLSSGIPDGRGRLYVYCNQNGTSDWDLILTREGVEPDSGFGMSVGVNELNDMIIACAGDPYLESKGAAWLYRGDENPANWTNLLSVSGEETGADFGMSVAIANKYIAIGAPGATTNAPGGAAYLVSGWDSDSLDSWHVLRPLDSIHEAWGFGKSVDITFSGSTYRIAVGLPGLEGNTQQWGAGGIDLFSGMESDGEWSVSRFNHHCRVIPLVPNRDNRLGGVVHFNEGVLYALNNSSDAPAVQDANESGIALFQNIDSSYWIREGGGNVNTASNWSVPPQENDELVFSLLGSIQYLVSMGGVANGHLRIAFDQILMVLNPEDSNTAKSMTIASPADIQSARVLLAEGGLMF